MFLGGSSEDRIIVRLCMWPRRRHTCPACTASRGRGTDAPDRKRKTSLSTLSLNSGTGIKMKWNVWSAFSALARGPG